MKKSKQLLVKVAEETLEQLDQIVVELRQARPDINRSDVVRELIAERARAVEKKKSRRS